MRLGHVVRICETHIFVIHTYILTYMSHSLTFMSHVSMRLTHYRSLLRKNPVKDIYVSRICETHICVCHKYASLTVSHICLTYLWGSHMCETHMYVSPGSECAFHTDINRAYCTYVWDCTLTCLWVLEVNVHFIMGHMVHMCETAHTYVRESRKCTLTYMWVLEVNAWVEEVHTHIHVSPGSECAFYTHINGAYGTYVWDCTHTCSWVQEVHTHIHVSPGSESASHTYAWGIWHICVRLHTHIYVSLGSECAHTCMWVLEVNVHARMCRVVVTHMIVSYFLRMDEVCHTHE